MARGSRTGRKTDYSWSGICGIANTIAAANTLGSGLITFSESGTIYRLRGHVSVSLDVAAADNRQCVAVGLIVGTDVAVVAGATAFPSPLSDPDAEWIWHGFFNLVSITGTQSDSGGGQFQEREIDSKAMRKVKTNSNVVLLADGEQQGGTPTADVGYGFRLLFGH